jgi:hypothetical protein
LEFAREIKGMSLILCARIPEVFAKFRKFFDEADRRPEAGTVNAGNERDVLAAAQGGIRAQMGPRENSVMPNVGVPNRHSSRRVNGTVCPFASDATPEIFLLRLHVA